ncbi:MAG: undecaprenyldiphospho-muramoylpentapeptide beta-N-acetylglucosaminyltransferase [Bacillota bacterium]|nr:undecaprenyldiphospho-muramoylpentapeptide beta-N-acetylglucosaminyltransferase [Bacillota bacterium]
MRFMFACGGTAGHINPAIAVAGHFRKLMPDCEILFVGAEGHMETNLVPRSGYEIKTLKVTNISRSKSIKGLLHNIKSVVNVIRARIKARRIIRDFAPDVVIGTGGYVCYPVLKAAAKMGIPTAVHESNAFPGLTTRMLADIVDKIMLGFEESKEHYKHPERCVVTGTPVRGEFGEYTKASAKAELGIAEKTPLVVSVWGSLGASNMNATMCEFIRLAGSAPGFRLIHSAGSEGYETMITALMESVPDYEANGMDVREYIYDMPRVMAAADIVLCRAGASTISELTYMHKPTVFVPSPYVTNDHQYKNASVVANAGGAKIFKEKELNAEELYNEVKRILDSPDELDEMAAAMEKLAMKDATKIIAEQILDLCK